MKNCLLIVEDDREDLELLNGIASQVNWKVNKEWGIHWARLLLLL